VGSGFNLGLIIGVSGRITTDRVVVFSGLSDMLNYGFQTGDPEYVAASLYFAASQKPDKVAIGYWNSGSETLTAALTACRSKNTDWYAVMLCGATSYNVRDIAAFVETASPASAQFYTAAGSDNLNSSDPVAAGFETGAAGPSTDIHSATTPTFKIAVDADVVASPNYQSITLTPAGLTTGLLIAAAMQVAIRALGGFYANVAVAFAGGVYVITSSTKGNTSKVRVANGASNDVAATLKIGAANAAVDTDGTGSIGAYLKSAGFTRSLGQYSTGQDSVASIMGYAMGANTGLLNSAYTLAYKSEPGVTPEVLTEAQVTILKGKNLNIYINRGNTYNLFEQGVMADGTHFDQLLGLDILANNIQIAVLNLLTSVNKVPQTEAGMTQLYNVISQACRKALTSGFIAPGVWQGAPILTLNTGDMLSQGFLVLSESIDSQSEDDRTARKAPPIYVPIKLAGAVEFAVVQVNVNY
jgi:hypothetical protein